jgi:hypothetical protein
MTVAVWGKGLSLFDYNADGLVIKGDIQNMEFFPDGKSGREQNA